jgi:hypothetical protein
MRKIKYLIPFFLIISLITYCGCEEKNRTGEITKVALPDSLKLPTAAQARTLGSIRAWASDPDGLDDIKQVYFYTQKPDGNLSNSGNPFIMSDNGEASYGDEIAGDGVFSMIIELNPTNMVGRYLFTFYMKDKDNSVSDAVIDSIEVFK